MVTQGIVLGITRYSDDKVMMHVFTRHAGARTFAVRRRAGEKKRGLSSALLQPLTQIEFDCPDFSDGKVHNLLNASLSPVYASIPFNPHKSAIAMFLAEFMWQAMRGEQPQDVLFDYISLSLLWLDGADEGYENFHLVFLLQLTRYLGYDPTHLPEGEALLVPRLMRLNFRTMRLLKLTQSARRDFLERLVLFYKDMVPGFGPVKSLGVLEEVYED